MDSTQGCRINRAASRLFVTYMPTASAVDGFSTKKEVSLLIDDDGDGPVLSLKCLKSAAGCRRSTNIMVVRGCQRVARKSTWSDSFWYSRRPRALHQREWLFHHRERFRCAHRADGNA